MLKNWVDKVNGYGVLFRFVTPILLTIIGTLILGNLNHIKEEQSSIRCDLATFQKETQRYNTNHLEHHRTTEIIFEGRLSKIESLLDYIYKQHK